MTTFQLSYMYRRIVLLIWGDHKNRESADRLASHKEALKMKAATAVLKPTREEQRLSALRYREENFGPRSLAAVIPSNSLREKNESDLAEVSPIRRKRKMSSQPTLDELSAEEERRASIASNPQEDGLDVKNESNSVYFPSQENQLKGLVESGPSRKRRTGRSQLTPEIDSLQKTRRVSSVRSDPTEAAIVDKIDGPFVRSARTELLSKTVGNSSRFSSSSGMNLSGDSVVRKPSVSVEKYYPATSASSSSYSSRRSRDAADQEVKLSASLPSGDSNSTRGPFQSIGTETSTIRRRTLGDPMASSSSISSSSSSAVYSILQPSVRSDRTTQFSETVTGSVGHEANNTSVPYPSATSSGPFSSVDTVINPSLLGISNVVNESNETTSTFLHAIRQRVGPISTIPIPSSFSLQSKRLVEVAEFARKRSAVIPTFPAGTLPLLWVMVFLIGMSLIVYTSLCSSRGNCIDPRAMLNSFGQMDSESATELYERAKASVAPTADYVADKLNQIWIKICNGEISELSQLFTDRDIRIAVIMYIGAVIACTGGYLTFATMSDSNNLIQIVSTFSTSDSLQLISGRFEANSIAFTQWRKSTSSNIFSRKMKSKNKKNVKDDDTDDNIDNENVNNENDEDDNDNDNAITPIFSLSSFFKNFVKGILWVVKKGKEFFQFNKEEREEKNIENTDVIVNKINENVTEEIENSEEMNRKKIINENLSSEIQISENENLSSSSSERFRNQLTIFLKAKNPQILSFLQRLDILAGIFLMLLFLLFLFLYHRIIKQFISICFIPCMTVIFGFFVGKLSYTIFRWNSNKKELKKKQIILVASYAKKLLSNKHNGGPYPIEFLFEEMKDIISDGVDDTVLANIAVSPFKKRRVSFGVINMNKNKSFSPLPSSTISSLKDEYNELNDDEQVDLKTLKLLWIDIQKEVLSDRRILSVLMIFEGAQRKCWKTMGVKNIASPIPPISNRTAAAHVLSGNRNNKDWGLFGWFLFLINILTWVVMGVFQILFYLLSFLWKKILNMK